MELVNVTNMVISSNNTNDSYYGLEKKTLNSLQPEQSNRHQDLDGSSIVFTVIVLVVILVVVVVFYYLLRCVLSEDALLSLTRSGSRRNVQDSQSDKHVKEEPLFSQKISSVDSECYFVIRGVHPEEHSLTVRRVGTDPMYHVTEPKKNKMDEVFTKDTIEKSEQLKSKRKSMRMGEAKAVVLGPIPAIKLIEPAAGKEVKSNKTTVVGGGVKGNTSPKVIVKTTK